MSLLDSFSQNLIFHHVMSVFSCFLRLNVILSLIRTFSTCTNWNDSESYKLRQETWPPSFQKNGWINSSDKTRKFSLNPPTKEWKQESLFGICGCDYWVHIYESAYFPLRTTCDWTRQRFGSSLQSLCLFIVSLIYDSIVKKEGALASIIYIHYL